MVVSPASAKTWNVNTSQEILDALNNCADGDTIFVMNGVYEIGDNKIITVPNITFRGESRDGVVIKSNNHILGVGGSNGAAPNCVIENFTGMLMTAGQKPNGISIYQNSTGCIVQNVAISVPMIPITISANDCIVRNCVFDGCSDSGISIGGKNNTFKNNIVSNITSTFSLYIPNTATENIIENNIFNNSNPVYLRGENSTVANNTFLNDIGAAIALYSTTSKNNTIVRNNIVSNGIAINVVKNAGDGNKIYLNNFANTSGMSGTPPAITYWNSTEPMEYTYNGTTHTGYLGNFWGTAYTGSDSDGNGIGDISYTVPSSFGTDYAPLISPNENYGSSETHKPPSAPVASFSATPTSGDAPLTVNFTDKSTNTPTSWLWDFGDNLTDTEQNVSHTYTSAGNYTVNLTVANAAGNDTETKTDYITVKEASSESEWLEFQKDSSNSGYILSSAPTRDPELIWQSLTSSTQEPCGSGGVNVPPLISGNKVFVTAGNASVWAFNKDTGDLIWSKELSGGLVQTATPALGDGKLFVPTLEGDLYAFDPETGDKLWNTHVTDSNFECPITYYDHKLYIGDGLEGGSGDKYYYCYDDSGNLVWKHKNTNTSGFIWSGAAVVGNYLVYPVFEGKLVCLDKDTGTLVDEVDFSNSSDVSFALTDPGMFRSSVTYADGALYTSSERGQETGYCFKVGLNPDTGQFLNTGWATSIGFSTSTPVVYNGRVYVGHGEHGESGSMFCLNDSDGSVIWETPISGGVKSSPVVSIKNGKPYIYFTEAIVDGSIYCLNPDGTLAWHYNPPADDAYTLQGAALSDDKVYYGTDNGYLYCIGQGEAISPVANFSSDKQTGSFPLTVSFKDTSSNANKFLWDFGDGNTSTEVNPVHTYITAGNYTVTLTVKNEHGEDTKVAKDYIYTSKAPTTWTVKNGESIQEVIDTANSGDIIQVYSGEYHEVLTVNKTLTFKGIGDPVLNASGFTGVSGVTISADDVEFSGFKITGTEEMCFAISISSEGTLIEDNLIDDCAEGVWLTGTGNTLQGNNISNCWDFAAVLDNIGDNRIYQNTFINNNGKKMGGSNAHISGGSGSFFQSSETVEYFWNGTKMTGYMGNYYDDYTGKDSNGDGIGDTSYPADEGTDQYPLVLPFSNYVEEQENETIPEDSWFQFHGKVDHLGYSESGPKTNRTEWVSEDIDAISSSSPVIAGGKVFVICGPASMSGGTDDISQLAALDESSGDVLWNVSIPEAVYGSWASPAYDNGMVFTATGPELGCYNAKTGEKLWSFDDTLGSQGVVGSGPAIADGKVIFNDWDGSHYYCLDEYTGDLLWRFEVKGAAQSVPAYADGKFYLTSWGYGSSYQGHAYCVDAETGKEIWHTNNVVDNLCGSPAYKNGILYLTTYNFYGDGELLALDASDGQIIWKQSIERTDSTPAFAYGNVYVCGGASGYSNLQTYCFNATTGSLVWSTPSKAIDEGGIGGWTCSIAVADGLVYVGSEGTGYFGYENLYALDASTGDVVWYAPYAGSSPALSYGMLFSIGGDQKVYAFKDSSISPVANFTTNVTSGEAPLTVQFNDTSSGSPTSWAWDFENDGTIDSTEQNPIYTYTEAGNYTVNLTIKNSVGSNSTVKMDYITVSENSTPAEPPVAAFIADVTSGTAPLTVNFTDQSTGSPTSWIWDFGDGTNATNQNVSHTYTSAGNYTVNLTVANEEGNDSEVKTEYIIVSEPLPGAPVANFTAMPTSGDAPLTVNFTDVSTGTVSSYLWDFDNDGTVDSTEQNPIYTYTAAGNYTVNLTVSNAGGSDSEVKTEYIVVSEPLPGAPVADFTATPTSGDAPLTVNFTDVSTGTVSSYLWDFENDGTVDSTEQNPIYTYTAAGNYTVNLTVTGPGGSDSEVKTGYIDVSSPSPSKPVANFSASPTSGKAPLNVKFTDTSTGTPTSWYWTFGDGSKSYLQNPTHKYSKAGVYTVSLLVKNAAGRNTVTKTDYIKVITKPVANFTSSVTSGKAPLKVAFTDTSTGTPTKWTWDFGDGSKSYLQNPTHKYSKVGSYTVKLTATNAAGSNMVTKTDYIKVVTKPVAEFSASPTSGKAPLTVSFTDKSTGIPTKWKWSFGDGKTSTVQNPEHEYLQEGKYKVVLTVSNAAGSNTVTKTNYITVTTNTRPGIYSENE
ncbi:PKD domain-containing protein [Methanosarcina sp. DH1]|uniref:PKD domain-containing protein n=1 Tax=Methanosarcina sp. DH1 TaxID=2605695 RepID=UPI001E3E6014|nr:PKD domain-containing protein [Methanosarcina sp. DH1]